MDQESVEKECLRLLTLAGELVAAANVAHSKTHKKELLNRAAEYETMANKLMEEYEQYKIDSDEP